jgi:hypothetical protein
MESSRETPPGRVVACRTSHLALSSSRVIGVAERAQEKSSYKVLTASAAGFRCKGVWAVASLTSGIITYARPRHILEAETRIIFSFYFYLGVQHIAENAPLITGEGKPETVSRCNPIKFESAAAIKQPSRVACIT